MSDFLEDIEDSLTVLQQGGAILYPTDTIWGIGCDATNPEAVEKIYEIKNRPTGKSMIVLVAGEEDVRKYVPPAAADIFDYLKKVEKPTTVIYAQAIGLADNVINTNGSVAIRIVKDDFCRQLLQRFGKPIVSTSANLSGEKSPAGFKDISDTIKNEVGYIVKYKQNEDTFAAPSSIIKWENGKISIIRP